MPLAAELFAARDPVGVGTTHLAISLAIAAHDE
jgi:hypothetical protein